MALASSNLSASVCQERVVRVERQQYPAACVLATQAKLLLPRLFAFYVAVGDEITFPTPSAEIAGTEIYLTKKCGSGRGCGLYLAPIAREPAEAGQTKSVLRFGRDSSPGHHHSKVLSGTEPKSSTQGSNGELAKLGWNITTGHGFRAGIHFRSSSLQSLLLGEAVALTVLQDHANSYIEPFTINITKFDGTTATITNTLQQN